MKKIGIFVICFMLFSMNAYAEDYESLSKFVGKEVILNHYLYLPKMDSVSKVTVATRISSVKKEYRCLKNSALRLYRTSFEPFTVEFICYVSTNAMFTECINIKQIIDIKLNRR